MPSVKSVGSTAAKRRAGHRDGCQNDEGSHHCENGCRAQRPHDVGDDPGCRRQSAAVLGGVEGSIDRRHEGGVQDRDNCRGDHDDCEDRRCGHTQGGTSDSDEQKQHRERFGGQADQRPWTRRPQRAGDERHHDERRARDHGQRGGSPPAAVHGGRQLYGRELRGRRHRGPCPRNGPRARTAAGRRRRSAGSLRAVRACWPSTGSCPPRRSAGRRTRRRRTVR